MQRIPFSYSITGILVAFTFTGCGGYSSTGSVNGNSPVAPYITTQPANQTDAPPLYLSQVTIGGQKKNVLYVATEHGSVYAFDADSINGTTSTFLWKTSTLGSGETPSDRDSILGCNQIGQEIGITGTPVIDRTHNAIYVVAASQAGTSTYFQRLHALHLATGKELFGGPMNITATYPGTGDNSSGGNVIFDPKQYKETPGLLP